MARNEDNLLTCRECGTSIEADDDGICVSCSYNEDEEPQEVGID